MRSASAESTACASMAGCSRQSCPASTPTSIVRTRITSRPSGCFSAELDPAALLAYDADNLAARRLVTEPGRGATRESGHGHRRAPAAPSAPAATQGRSIGVSLEGRDADVQLYDILLDRKGATFSLGGRALTTQSGTRVSSPLLGRGHLRNVALAHHLRHRHRASSNDGAGSRRHADAAQAAHGAIRGRRPNRARRHRRASRQPRRDLRRRRRPAPPRARRGLRDPRPPRARHQPAHRHRAGQSRRPARREALIVTSAADRVGALDMPTAEEVDVTRQALVARGRRFVWHDGLGDAIRDAYARTKAGDLILLVGAQGMNDGKTAARRGYGLILTAAKAVHRRTPRLRAQFSKYFCTNNTQAY